MHHVFVSILCRLTNGREYYTMSLDAQSILSWSKNPKRFEKRSACKQSVFYLSEQESGLQVPFAVGRLIPQRIQYFQQFASDAPKRIIFMKCATASTESLQLTQHSFAPHKPVDIFTITPHQHEKWLNGRTYLFE